VKKLQRWAEDYAQGRAARSWPRAEEAAVAGTEEAQAWLGHGEPGAGERGRMKKRSGSGGITKALMSLTFARRDRGT
jgi:hypothetical protein